MATSTIEAVSAPMVPNGATTSFPFTFDVPTAEEVSVALLTAQGDLTVVDPADYTVTLNEAGGGTVVFSAAPASGPTLFVLLNPLFTQEILYTSGAKFTAEPQNEGLDRSAYRDRFLRAQIARAITVPIGEEAPVLPSASTRQGKFLGFSAVDGALIATEGTDANSVLAADIASTDAGKGAALVGIEGGGTAQDYFDGTELLPDAAGDGATDDRAHFAGTSKDTIFLRSGKTYYIATDLTISAKVVSLGGKMKRAAAATVTFAGGFEGPEDAQCFDLSNITPTARIQLDSDGTNEFQLGTGAFVISGKALLRWFMSSTGGDNSVALLALAETDAAEQWISTPCEFTYGVLGASPIIDAKLTMVEATKTYTATAGDPELNAFGEEREFYLRPKSGLDVFHCRFTPRGEVDGNASNSFDVADDFATMKATGANWWSKTSVNGISCTQDSAAVANGWWLAPEKIIIENAFIHSTIRNCIVANGCKDVAIINPRVANSYADHLIYADNVVKLRVERPVLSGFARDGLIVVGAGVINQVALHEDGLALNPIAGVETSRLINVRNDVAGHTRINFDLTGAFAPLHTTGTDRVLVWSSATGKVTISGYIKPTDADDNENFIIYSQSTTTEGVSITGLHCHDMTQAYLVRIADGNGDLEGLKVNDVKWDFRAGVTSANNAMIDCNGSVNLKRCTLRDFSTTGGQGIGWRYLLDVGASVEELLVDGCHFPTFNNGSQFAVIGGTASRCEVRNTRARSARPSSTLRGQITFKDSFYYGSSLDTAAGGWVTVTFSGDGTVKNSGTQAHAFGDAAYYILQPTSADAIAAGPARIVTGTNVGTIYVNTAWATGTGNVVYEVKYALSRGGL